MEFESLKEIPRQYQLDLYDKAKKSNVIAVLDTGTGKTLISLLVLKHVQSLDSSRFSIFLVPTVPLVSQQANYISINSSLSVFHIYGGMIDTSWTDYIGKFDVFVMTPSMFLTALDQGLCSLAQISLVVFDECHHCRLNHPYNLIMSQHYATCLKEKRPKIFGMTASPFGSSDQSRQAIEQLERNLDSIALSSSTNSSLQQYVSKPTERIVYYSEGDFFEAPKLYVKMMEICPKLYVLVEKELGDCMALCDMLGPWTAERALEIAIEEISLTIKRRIRDLEMKEAEDEFELLRKASDSIEELTIQEIDVAKIDGMLLDSVLKGVAVDEDATMEVDSGEPLPDELVFRKETDEESGEILEDELEEGEILSVQEYIDLKRKGSELMDGLLYKLPKTDGGPLEDFSKDELIDLLKGCDLLQHNPYWGERALPPKEEEIGAKVHCLINVLLEFEAEKEFFCGIVFCQQRLMAHVLKLLIQKHKQLPFIRCEYLLGHGKSAGLYRKSCLTAAAQQEIVRQFRNGEVNLLIATSVAEEGLDIKPCNCVIRFDMLESSLTSYIQSRGRARHRTSQFIIISKQGDDTSEHILQCIID